MRKICVVTSTRAEYGLLSPLLKQIDLDENLSLQLVVTGTHLLKEFGHTVDEIEFEIAKKVFVKLKDNSKVGVSNYMSKLQKNMTKTFTQLKPDIVVVLGDRYEIFSVALSATVLNIPIAHIHGGETTQGAMDEVFRHSITKMSHLHFTATKLYRNRVIQLGEQPKRVFNVGALGVENIENIKLLSKDEFEKSISSKLYKKNLLVTFHPTTLDKQSPKKQFKTILKALSKLKDTKIIFTKANADTGGVIINKMIDSYVKKHKNAIAFHSLGLVRYLSALRYVDGVVGNSSSGIIEAPNMGCMSVNIGNRQKGRESAKSVLHVDLDEQKILKAIKKLHRVKKVKNPYSCKNTSYKIKEVLKQTSLKDILQKEFYDLV